MVKHMFIKLPLDLLVLLATKLEFRDILMLSMANKANSALFNNVNFWQRYIKLFRLDKTVTGDPFWARLSWQQHRKFCSNYLNCLVPLRKLPSITMLDVVALIDELELLQQYCSAHAIPLDSALLARVAAYAPLWLLTNLIEKQKIPVTQGVVTQLFKQEDINVYYLAIELAFIKEITNNRKNTNDRTRYQREMMQSIICYGSRTNIKRLLDGGHTLVATGEFGSIIPRIPLDNFECLIDYKVIPCKTELLNKCANAGRLDLVFFLTQKKELQTTELTLRGLTRKCSLEQVQAFNECFHISPTDDTLNIARTNQDRRVLGYIENLTRNNHLALRT
jgi:hypothetical protein